MRINKHFSYTSVTRVYTVRRWRTANRLLAKGWTLMQVGVTPSEGFRYLFGWTGNPREADAVIDEM